MDVSEKVFVVVVLYQGLKKYRQRENTDNIEQSCSLTHPVPTANLAAAGVKELAKSWNGKTLAALLAQNGQQRISFHLRHVLFCGVVASAVQCQCVKKQKTNTRSDFYGTVSFIIQISALSFPFSTFTERKMDIYMKRNVFIQSRYVVLYEYEQACQLKWLSLRVYYS